MGRLGLLAVALALALPAQAGAAGWDDTSQTIADQANSDSEDPPTVVTGPRGQVAAAWAQQEGIGIAFAGRGRGFGPPQIVPRSQGGYAPAVGIDAAGNTTIA